MKILLLKPSENKYNHPRCCRVVKSTGTFQFDENKHRCDRRAKFSVDGVNFCKQHAGDAALQYLLNRPYTFDTEEVAFIIMMAKTLVQRFKNGSDMKSPMATMESFLNKFLEGKNEHTKS